MSIRWKVISYFIIPVVFIYLILMFLNLYNIQQAERRNVDDKISGLSEQYATSINGKLNEVALLAKTTALYLENNSDQSSKQIYKLLSSNLKLNPFVYGSAVCFLPYHYNKDTRLFVRYVYREWNSLCEVNPAVSGYDYTEAKHEYWHVPKNTGKAVWTSPYFDKGGGNILMATYSVPFFKNKSFLGIATVDIPLEPFWKKIDIDIPKNFSFYLITQKGKYVSSPYSEYINKSYSLLNKPYENDQIQNIIKTVNQEKSGIVLLKNTMTNKRDLVAYTSVKSTGWTLLVTCPEINAYLATKKAVL